MSQIKKFNSEYRKKLEKWDKFHHTNYEPEYQEILRALEADSIKGYIDRILKFQSEYKSNEVFSYVLTNDKNKIVAFTFFYLINRPDGKYDMFIQSIAVNPKYRKKGYATELLATIFSNPEKYIGQIPIDVAGFVFPWNIAGLTFFDKFANFERRMYRRKFYLIISDYKTVEQNSKSLLTNYDMKI